MRKLPADILYLNYCLVTSLLFWMTITTWVNQRLDAEVRATVLSMSSQVDAIGQIAGGLLLCAFASALSIQVGLLASSLSLSPVLGLISKGMKQEKFNQRDENQLHP